MTWILINSSLIKVKNNLVAMEMEMSNLNNTNLISNNRLSRRHSSKDSLKIINNIWSILNNKTWCTNNNMITLLNNTINNSKCMEVEVILNKLNNKWWCNKVANKEEASTIITYICKNRCRTNLIQILYKIKTLLKTFR